MILQLAEIVLRTSKFRSLKLRMQLRITFFIINKNSSNLRILHFYLKLLIKYLNKNDDRMWSLTQITTCTSFYLDDTDTIRWQQCPNNVLFYLLLEQIITSLYYYFSGLLSCPSLLRSEAPKSPCTSLKLDSFP